MWLGFSPQNWCDHFGVTGGGVPESSSSFHHSSPWRILRWNEVREHFVVYELPREGAIVQELAVSTRDQVSYLEEGWTRSTDFRGIRNVTAFILRISRISSASSREGLPDRRHSAGRGAGQRIEKVLRTTAAGGCGKAEVFHRRFPHVLFKH